jgi:hypothetical protein
MENAKGKLLEESEKWLFFVSLIAPVISVVGLMDMYGLSIWLKISLMAYMVTGLGALYIANLYPRLQHNAMFLGFFIFGISILWPIWMVSRKSNAEPGVIQDSIKYMVLCIGVLFLGTYIFASLIAVL